MGYYVRRLKNKKSIPAWKIQYISTRKQDRKPASIAKTSKTAWDIPRLRWSSLGFTPSMTTTEAQARSRQLNSQIQLKRQEEQIREIQSQQQIFALNNAAVLPDHFVAEFEEKFVRARHVLSDSKRKMRTRNRFTSWRAAQKFIARIGLEPSQWFYNPGTIYDAFCASQVSLSYMSSILGMMNLWGNFISRKLNQPFTPIFKPRGYERQRFLEAYYQKTTKHRVPSAPITPMHLELIRGKINVPNFNWLFISVWLGLRPQEIDQLSDQSMWKLETLPTGRKLLWVFQTKIVALPPEDRWKPIPILFDEQHFALKSINDQIFRRPLVKTIRKHIGEGHDTYGGRKGFVDLMLSKNQSLENISIWMGHSTLDRTWRSYKQKRVFQYHRDR